MTTILNQKEATEFIEQLLTEDEPLFSGDIDLVHHLIKEKSKFLLELFTDGSPYIPEMGNPQRKVDLIRVNAGWNPIQEDRYPVSFLLKQYRTYQNVYTQRFQ